jgi:hypothetical protein
MALATISQLQTFELSKLRASDIYRPARGVCPRDSYHIRYRRPGATHVHVHIIHSSTGRPGADKGSDPFHDIGSGSDLGLPCIYISQAAADPILLMPNRSSAFHKRCLVTPSSYVQRQQYGRRPQIYTCIYVVIYLLIYNEVCANV